MRLRILLVEILLWLSFNAVAQQPIDKQAEPETVALYQNLHRISGKHLLFGHQHATEYGHGWRNLPNTSDVKLVTGAHPAVIGVDIGSITNPGNKGVEQEKLRLKKVITDTYNRGGVVTIAWHFNNPLSGGGFYWKENQSLASVPLLIPGGSHHHVYKTILADLAAFFRTLQTSAGDVIPLIFRPYHELDGNWFWWGKQHCTAEEIQSLWKFTVHYLRDSMQVHNLLYAFSPDAGFTNEEQLLERYPGDAYVDLIGMDNYADFGRNGPPKTDLAIRKLQVIQTYATRAGKLTALTETGLESIPIANWWTQTLLPVVAHPELKLAYVLVWRNDPLSDTHFYAPYPGQLSAPDFVAFYKHPFTWFESDLPPMYK